MLGRLRAREKERERERERTLLSTKEPRGDSQTHNKRQRGGETLDERGCERRGRRVSRARVPVSVPVSGTRPALCAISSASQMQRRCSSRLTSARRWSTGNRNLATAACSPAGSSSSSSRHLIWISQNALSLSLSLSLSPSNSLNLWRSFFYTSLSIRRIQPLRIPKRNPQHAAVATAPVDTTHGFHPQGILHICQGGVCAPANRSASHGRQLPMLTAQRSSCLASRGNGATEKSAESSHQRREVTSPIII